MNAHQPAPRLRPDDATIAALTAELHRRYGNRVVTSLAVREQHANTLTWVENQPPDVVVYPQSTDEVAEIVKLCADATGAGHRLRHRHLLRGPHQRASSAASRSTPA